MGLTKFTHRYCDGALLYHYCSGGFLRSFNAKQTFDNLIVAYRGMADAFAGVVMLLVAAGVFAQSLSTIGFITNLIASAQSFGGSAFFMMLVLAVITI